MTIHSAMCPSYSPPCPPERLKLRFVPLVEATGQEVPRPVDPVRTDNRQV